MSFSSQLRRRADPIFRATLAHPFVQGIAKQTIAPDALIHYVSQDIQYLETYARVYGMAIAKSPNRHFMELFHRRIELILHSELTAHLTMCKVAGVDYATLYDERKMAPTAQHYASHMLSTANMGRLGEIIAVILPCHWIYVDIAKSLQKEVEKIPSHLFYDWITFYANNDMASGLLELINALDVLAQGASLQDLRRMEDVFLISCQMEYKFFDMAYRLEDWPVKADDTDV